MPTENMNIRVTLQNAAKRGLTGLSKDLKKVDKSAAKAASGMKGLYTQMVAFGALLAGGALFGSSIKAFAAFDDNMRAAAAVTGATTVELQKMTEAAREMGRTTRFTAGNAAEALRFLGMAGFTATESTKALPGVLNLAASGALDLGTAADIATNVLTAFGLEVENLGQVNDVLVKTFTSSNVNLIEMGEAFKMVGPVAKGVGSDFEDLLGSIGALGNAGIKGTMAGSALKNAIDALLAPTGKEAALMKKLEARLGGVSLKVKDAQGDFVGFKKVIEQLEKAGLRGDEALAAFGLRAGPAMVALLNQGSESLDELIGKLKEAGGTAEDIANQMEAGIGGQLRKTKSVIESFKITLGEAFGPEIIVVLKAFRGWLVEITNTIIALKENGDLAGIGQTIIDVFSVVNTVISKSVDIMQSFTALAIAAAAALTGNFDLAKEAMKGWVKETNDIFKTWDGTVTKPITEEMQAARKVIENAGKETGPIGKGAKKAGDALVKNLIPVVTLESKLKAGLIKLNAILTTEKAQLESDYDQKLISLDNYYDKRLSIVTRRIQEEQKVLQDKIDSEKDISKKEILNAKMIALDQALLTETININNQRKQDQDKLDKDLFKKTKDLNKKKLNAEKAFRDQENRLKTEGVTTLDAQFQDEIAKLQDRQNKELEVIRNYHETIIQNLKDSKASELEIEKAYQAEKQAVDDQVLLQQQEKQQQLADQTLRLSEYKINNLKQIAGGTADVFNQLYEVLGKKNKELFYISKAAAIAEATMNIAQGITKAMAQGGVWGIAQGALVAAAGAAQIATIASQGLAEGGEVLGASPSPTADNIDIKATAGEFVHPVSSVQYYGKGMMEAIRNKAIPKAAFAGYATGGIIRKGRANRFADGGLISGSGSSSENQNKDGSPNINIINVTDPKELDSYLATSEGQDAILNVLGTRAQTAKRLIMGGI